MEKSIPSGRSYWDLLGAALRALDAGDFPVAEREFELALAERIQSPGRVFFTEKIVDSLGRLLGGKKGGLGSDGRWLRRSGDFRRRFLAEGEQVVRMAVRLAELRPEDDAETNQPVLETALYLVGRSRLFSEEPASAVPLLKGIFRTAGKTGRPFDVQLIRHDIPLTEEDRLWLARKGPEVLEEFVTNGVLEPGSPESETWVQVILQLLHPRYFGSTTRLEEERAWLEAVTTDRLLCRSDDSVALYKSYLQVNPEPGPRPDEARIRLLEMQANIGALNFPVPLYNEALGAMQAAGLASGSAASDRFQLALEKMDYRRPDPEPGSEGTAWASVGLEPDGRLAVVFWWKDEPRDVAFWSAGNDPAPMIRFLEPCAGRIVAADPQVVEAVGTAWEDPPAPWSVREFAVAILEPSLPDCGLDEATLLKVGLGESGPWRRGWQSDLGHALLDPPRRSALLETWQGGRASGALLGGLVWLAVVSRITRSDPCLRAGIGEMSRRGDPAAEFLYGFLNLDQGLGQTIDASFEAWTLPLLWTRPDPFGWSAAGGSSGLAPTPGDNEPQARPDLGRNDLAIVTTGDPGAVLTAWGDGRQKWRVVLDRLDRLPAVARVAAAAIGPVTLIPAGGRVHSLEGALRLLGEMLTRAGRPAGRVDGLLPLFHWVRLVESHNGDVLDFLQVRPRPGADIPLFAAYRDLVADLELVEPALESGQEADPWATQFSQRVRKAGLVAGLADGLTLDANRLDSLWGVFEGSDASWVFLDSAAIHWYLLSHQEVGIQELHTLLHSRGSRHLSLLVGAVWMRSELEDLLGTWLGVFGSPYCLALTNMQPPLLRLVDRGIIPDAVQLAAEAHAGPVAQVAESIDLAGTGTVLLPSHGSHGELWRQIASGKIPLGKSNWGYLDPFKTTDTALPRQDLSSASKLLMVPILDSLSDVAVPIALQDSSEAWLQADQERAGYLAWRRRLCGLEIAGLLAGPWDTVEILDCRWWRLLAAEGDPTDPTKTAGTGWSGEAALTLAAPNGCRLFNLPGVESGKGRTIHPNILATIRHWLATKGALPPDLLAPRKNVSEGQNFPEGKGVSIAIQDAGTIWESLVQPVARKWEQCQLDAWVLLVGERMPSSGAAIVAGGFSPGISIWSKGSGSLRPAPVLWCRSADLEDPDLRAFLKRVPPSTVLALDVEKWLPSAFRTGQAGATALRALLDCPTKHLVLQTRQLTAPWISFLARETGGLVLDPDEMVSPASEEIPDDLVFLPPTSEVTDPFPDTGRATTPDVIVRRMRRLLLNLRPALGLGLVAEGEGSSDRLPPGRQLVSLSRLSLLAGLPAEQIAAGFRLLRWVARLAGDSLSDAGGREKGRRDTEPGHSLLIPWRFAELEHLLGQLEQELSVLLPMILVSRRPGVPTWFDLEFPPVQLDRPHLDLLDRLLAFWADSASQNLGLIYLCPRGILNSTRRLVGTTVPAAEVLANIQEGLVLFRSRLNDVMGSAVETGGGFLVETGLRELRDEEQEFLALGSSLGFWIWSGPACPGALHAVDLLTTAGSPTVLSGDGGWTLLAEELALHLGSTPDSIEQVADEETRTAESWKRRHQGGLRSLLPGSTKLDELDTLADRVSALVHPRGDPGLLVVSGLAGTGRHQALVRGLQHAQAEAGVLGQITVFCPDVAAGAHFMRQFSAAGAWGQIPDVQVVGRGRTLPRSGSTREAGAAGSDAIVVMLEIHRFVPEVRYQIAQLGRGRRLLMTTDPGASTEPWEHLFLTVPRASEVVRLEMQRAVSRKVWTEIRPLLPDGFQGKALAQSQRKGGVTAVYAVNLDQCLARMVQEVADETLPQRFRLVGPLASDLDFLAMSLKDRGWVAVPEKELDALLLPGPREMLAAATGALAELGLLARFFPGQDGAHKADAEHTPGPVSSVPGEILARYLGRAARRQLRPWLDSCGDLDPHLSLGDFMAGLERWPWIRPVLAEPQAALRIHDLLGPWAEVSLAELPEHPLWEAWWYTARDDLGLPDTVRRRPLVTLAPADQSSGSPVAAGVYLCLGTELSRQHYNVLSRMTDVALILYKEKSPLAAEAAN